MIFSFLRLSTQQIFRLRQKKCLPTRFFFVNLHYKNDILTFFLFVLPIDLRKSATRRSEKLKINYVWPYWQKKTTDIYREKVLWYFVFFAERKFAHLSPCRCNKYNCSKPSLWEQQSQNLYSWVVWSNVYDPWRTQEDSSGIHSFSELFWRTYKIPGMLSCVVVLTLKFVCWEFFNMKWNEMLNSEIFTKYFYRSKDSIHQILACVLKCFYFLRFLKYSIFCYCYFI